MVVPQNLRCKVAGVPPGFVLRLMEVQFARRVGIVSGQGRGWDCNDRDLWQNADVIGV